MAWKDRITCLKLWNIPFHRCTHNYIPTPLMVFETLPHHTVMAVDLIEAAATTAGGIMAKTRGKPPPLNFHFHLVWNARLSLKKKKTFTSIIKTKGENTKWLRRSKRSFHFIKRCKQPSITGSFSERQQEQQKGIKCLESKTCGQLSSCLFHEPLCPHLSFFLICEIGITVQGFSKAQGDESAYEL